MSSDWTPDEHRISDALHDEANHIMPTAGGLAQIRARTQQPPWWRRPAVLGVAVATATAGAVIAAAMVVMNPDDSTPLGSPSTHTDSTVTAESTPTTSPTEPTSPPPESPTTSAEPETEAMALPVYYSVEAPQGLRLAREFHSTQTADPIADAIRHMVGAPHDPDYGSLWLPSTEVLSVVIQDGTIVVDLQSPATSAQTEADEAMAVQQLVYTATAATFAATEQSLNDVRVLVDGAPAEIFSSVDLTQPQQRADELSTRLLVQVEVPDEGAITTSPVTISGTAAAFEAALEWEVRSDDGSEIESDTAATEEGQKFSPFSFTVELDPGTYQIEVRDTDASGGEGPGPTSDTKTFTVE